MHVYDRCHSYILRNFLRLGNPLNCSLNDITVQSQLIIVGKFLLQMKKQPMKMKDLELLIRLHLMEVPSLGSL